MTTQIIRQETRQITDKERRSLWEKLRSLHMKTMKTADVLEAYSQRRLGYLEADYGQRWLTNRHGI